MSKVNPAELADQLDTLLAHFNGLQSRSQYDDLSDLKSESRILATRLQAAIDRIAPPGTSYYRAADEVRTAPTHLRVAELAGIAYGLRDDLEAGWANSVVELVHNETYADLIDIANELLSAKYKDAAAVIAGTGLELHLRALASKSGITISDSKGKFKKADSLKIELRQGGVITPLTEKRVTYWLGLRNAAAHGNYHEYAETDIRQLIDDIAAFADGNPA